MAKPVLFFAFANEPPTSTAYLRNLPREAIGLRQILTAAVADDLCEFVLIEHATLEAIVEVFQNPRYRGRIAGFHFAGHAGADRLFVNDAAAAATAAYQDGLVPFLSGQDALQLVFLNGCHTLRTAQALTEAGISAVIGTSEAVRDEVATELALTFYRGLCRGLQLDRAWHDAIAVLRATTDGSTTGRFYRPDAGFREDVRLPEAVGPRPPWSLRYRPGREDIRYWNLPAAVANPLFGLPSIDNLHDLPNEPYEYLRSYGSERARLFFGRGAEIYELYHRLLSDTASPILLLHGQSGVGKSSLLTAGLLPRLALRRTVRTARRSRERGLSSDLDDLLRDPGLAVASREAPDPGEWLARWRAIEHATDRPLVVILDQVEELFTRPSREGAEELSRFVARIAPLFSQPAHRPRGKLILSYRKEFHPEIDHALRGGGLPFETIFITKLTATGVEEIVSGLTSTEAHRAKYALRIEAGLPHAISTDLLRDSDSPVAPVLQILLTKLWQRSATDKGTRAFSLSTYQELRRQGLFLDDFFQEQLSKLAVWGHRQGGAVVDSGLALDVLNYHTTPYGTAESRSLPDLLAQYAHHPNLVPALIRELQALYLLSDTGQNQTSLAHDTLATIVRREIRKSDRPGQRALRLLETKMLDFPSDPMATSLAEEDLQTVESGREGMRAWSAEEQRLIAFSRVNRDRARARRRRERLVQRAGVAAVVLALLVVSVAWRNSRIQAQGNELVAAALALETTDPRRSLELVHRAAAYLPDAPAVLQARHDIYSYHEFYDTILRLNFPVTQVALAPGDSILAAAAGPEVTLWDSQSLRPRTVLPHDATVTYLAFAPDGAMILTGTEGSGLNLWSGEGRVVSRYGQSRHITAAALSSDQRRVLAADQAGQVVLWNSEEDSILVLDDFYQTVETVAFSPLGDTLLIGDGAGGIQLFDTLGTSLRTIPAHRDRVLSLDWRSGLGILSASRDATAAIWSVEGHLRQRLTGHEKRVNAVRWLPLTGDVLTASDDYSVRLWTADGQPRNRYRGHTDFVQSIAIAGSARWFISGSADSTLRIWRLESKVADHLPPAGRFAISCLALSPDGRFLVAGTQPIGGNTPSDSGFFAFEDLARTQPQPVWLWDGEGQGPLVLAGHNGRINAAAVAPSGNHFLTGAADGKAILWHASGEPIRTFGHGGEVNAVAFAPDGSAVLTAGSDSLAILWDTSGRRLALLPHGDLVSAVAFSPDGSGFYTASFDQLVRRFDRRGRLVAEWNGHANRVSCLAVSPDGRQVLSGDWDNQAIRWSTEGRELGRYALIAKNSTGGAAIRAVAFAPDGKRIAIGAENGVVKVFDSAGRELQTLSAMQSGDVNCLAFHPHTGQLLTGGGTGVRFWSSVATFLTQ